MTLFSISLRRRLVRVRRWFREAVAWLADGCKDFLLDWGAVAAARRAARELPPLSPPQFVEAMRGHMEWTLWQVAHAINQAPTGNVVVATEEAVRGLFGELWWDALELGAQMRVNAALAELPAAPGAPDGWAAKYRRMRVEEGCPPFQERTPRSFAGQTGSDGSPS
jgi:hypothetical protein